MVPFAETLLELGLEPSVEPALDVEQAAAIWGVYLPRLVAASRRAEFWAEDEADAVEQLLARALAGGGERRLFALSPHGASCVGLPLSASDLVASTLMRLVSRSADLMLASADAADGLCLELNAKGRQNAFELSAWGSLSPGETVSLNRRSDASPEVESGGPLETG